MTRSQFIATLVYVASLEIRHPEFDRHHLARRELMRCLRGVG